MSITEESYFQSEAIDVHNLENRDVYPLDNLEQIKAYNAKIISVINAINAKPVPRLKGRPIGFMPDAYKEKAKTLIRRLLTMMYKQIECADGKIIDDDIITSKLFAFNSKYNANLNFDWRQCLGQKQ